MTRGSSGWAPGATAQNRLTDVAETLYKHPMNTETGVIVRSALLEQ